MPPKKGTGVFAAFYKSVYKSALVNKSFEKEFNDFSDAGSKRGMVGMIMDLPQVNQLKITESYTCKNDADALELLKEAGQMKPSENNKIILLTKALLAVDIKGEANIFPKILINLIKSLYKAEAYSKCMKNCEFLINLLSPRADDSREYRIDCFLYKLKCLDRLGMWEEAKTCTKEGMNEVNDLIKMRTKLGDDISNEGKMELLRPFLELLKEMKGKECNSLQYVSRIAVPLVDGMPDAKLRSCSDSIALRYNEKIGRHVVATRNIKAGSVLIVDEPFAWSTDEEALERNCLHCHASFNLEENFTVPCHSCQAVRFCSEECRAQAWEKYHKYECTIFDFFYSIQGTRRSQLLLAYRTAVSKVMENAETELRLNSNFMEYYSAKENEVENLKIQLDNEYNSLDYGTVYSLQTNQEKILPKVNLMHTIHSVFLAKCFVFVLKDVNSKIHVVAEEEVLLAIGIMHHLQAINCNAYEIVENVRDEESKAWEPRNIGGALYTTVSLVNHGCYPNVVRHSYPHGKVVVRAVRFIPKNAEILDCYGPHFLRETRNERRKYLMEKYHFLCECVACTNNWQLPLTTTLYKCKSCSNRMEMSLACCPKCRAKLDRKKIEKRLKESMNRRSDAIDQMFHGDYETALPILLEHAEITEKILAEPSFDAVKTQQAIIQCLNSMGCVSK